MGNNVNSEQYKKINLLTSLLTVSQTTNFRLFQTVTERVCRQKFHIWWKW